MVKTIAILTGGGDVPGLNASIKTLVVRANDLGIRVLGIRRGWAGLLGFNPDDPGRQEELVCTLDRKSVRAIDRSGGTHLHTSRTNPGRVRREDWPDFVSRNGYVDLDGGVRDYTRHVCRVIESLGIDLLIPIGGDDTLGYAARLDREGVSMISIPKTMDNDVFGTEMCIGFSTAITRSVDLITALRTCVGSHERIGIIELFGRRCGETVLISSYLAQTDRAVLSEVPFDVERLAGFLMADKAENPSNYTMLTISEGATMVGGQHVEYGEEDAFGHRKLGGIGLIVSEAIKKLTGQRTVYQQLAYLMRSGVPDALDRMIAISFANLVMELMVKGLTGRMVAVQDGNYVDVPAATPGQGTKIVDVERFYDSANYRPKIQKVLGMPLFIC